VEDCDEEIFAEGVGVKWKNGQGGRGNRLFNGMALDFVKNVETVSLIHCFN